MSGTVVAQPAGAATARAEGQGGAEMQGMPDLQGHIEETRRLCGSLTHMLQKDAQCVHMAFHHTSGVDVGKSNRSTVGIMLSGTRIDSILPGGPAQGSQVNKGHMIIAVDDQAATSENVSTLLVGNDDPGVGVILTLKNSSGAEMDVCITRMATAKIADRRRVFDLFASIKDRVLKKTGQGQGGWFGSSDPDSGKSTVALVDEAVELWSKMLEADHLVQQNVLHEVGRLQREGSQHAAGLADVVAKIDTHLVSLQIVTPDALRATGRDLERKVVECRRLLAEERGRVDALQTELAAAWASGAAVHDQLAAVQAGVVQERWLAEGVVNMRPELDAANKAMKESELVSQKNSLDAAALEAARLGKKLAEERGKRSGGEKLMEDRERSESTEEEVAGLRKLLGDVEKHAASVLDQARKELGEVRREFAASKARAEDGLATANAELARMGKELGRTRGVLRETGNDLEGRMVEAVECGRQLGEERGRVDALEAEVSAARSSEAAAKNAWEEAVVEVRELEKGLGEVRGSLGATIQGLQAEVAASQQHAESVAATLGQQFKEELAAVLASTDRDGSLTTEGGGLNAGGGQLAGMQGSVDQERSSTEEGMAKMRTELDEVRKELAASKAKVVAGMAFAVESIQGVLEKSEQTIDGLRAEVARLQADRASTTLTTSNARTGSESSPQQQQIDFLREAVSRLLETERSLTGVVETLEKRLEEEAAVHEKQVHFLKQDVANQLEAGKDSWTRVSRALAEERARGDALHARLDAAVATSAELEGEVQRRVGESVEWSTRNEVLLGELRREREESARLALVAEERKEDAGVVRTDLGETKCEDALEEALREVARLTGVAEEERESAGRLEGDLSQATASAGRLAAELSQATVAASALTATVEVLERERESMSEEAGRLEAELEEAYGELEKGRVLREAALMFTQHLDSSLASNVSRTTTTPLSTPRPGALHTTPLSTPRTTPRPLLHAARQEGGPAPSHATPQGSESMAGAVATPRSTLYNTRQDASHATPDGVGGEGARGGATPDGAGASGAAMAQAGVERSVSASPLEGGATGGGGEGGVERELGDVRAELAETWVRLEERDAELVSVKKNLSAAQEEVKALRDQLAKEVHACEMAVRICEEGKASNRSLQRSLLTVDADRSTFRRALSDLNSHPVQPCRCRTVSPIRTMSVPEPPAPAAASGHPAPSVWTMRGVEAPLQHSDGGGGALEELRAFAAWLPPLPVDGAEAYNAPGTAHVFNVRRSRPAEASGWEEGVRGARRPPAGEEGGGGDPVRTKWTAPSGALSRSRGEADAAGSWEVDLPPAGRMRGGRGDAGWGEEVERGGDRPAGAGGYTRMGAAGSDAGMSPFSSPRPHGVRKSTSPVRTASWASRDVNPDLTPTTPMEKRLAMMVAGERRKSTSHAEWASGLQIKLEQEQGRTRDLTAELQALGATNRGWGSDLFSGASLRGNTESLRPVPRRLSAVLTAESTPVSSPRIARVVSESSPGTPRASSAAEDTGGDQRTLRQRLVGMVEVSATMMGLNSGESVLERMLAQRGRDLLRESS